MKNIPENWGSYFANVNDKLASIALNLGLRAYDPPPSSAALPQA
jgi:hypothetical protein